MLYHSHLQIACKRKEESVNPRKEICAVHPCICGGPSHERWKLGVLPSVSALLLDCKGSCVPLQLGKSR